MNLFSIFLAVSIPNNSDNRHRKEKRRVTIYRVRWNAFRCKGQEQNEIRDIFDRIYVILSMMRNIWNLPEPFVIQSMLLEFILSYLFCDHMKWVFETIKNTGKLSNLKNIGYNLTFLWSAFEASFLNVCCETSSSNSTYSTTRANRVWSRNNQITCRNMSTDYLLAK